MLRDAGMMETVTDVDPATVDEWFTRYGVDTMIHGHTHRPAIHTLQAAGRDCRRIVLGDWFEQGSVLRAEAAIAAARGTDRAPSAQSGPIPGIHVGTAVVLPPEEVAS